MERVISGGKDCAKSQRYATAQARRAVRDIKTRPVDDVAGTNSRFNEYGKSLDSLYVESEVFRKGLLLYDHENEDSSVENAND